MDKSKAQLSTTEGCLNRKASKEEQPLAKKKTSNALSLPSNSSYQVQNDFRGPINAEMVNANAGDINIHKTEIKICPVSNPVKKAVEEISEELKTALRSAAKVEAGEVSFLVKLERALVPVPLRMSNAPSRIPDEEDSRGHFSRRNEMQLIFDQEHQHDISVDELFTEAEKCATKEAKRTCKSEEARNAFLEKKCKVAGVVGQAGIGKTTFLRSLNCKILANEFQHPVSYLFYIPIRQMDFSSEPKNLLHFLLRSILPSWKHSPETDEALLTAIAEDPYTLIAFDGLDEADVKAERFGEKVPNINMYEESSTWAFLVNLIGGNLLPLAYKIITSRPSQIYSLHLSKRPLFLAEILGLDSANQIALGKQICGCRYPEIKAVLDRNDNLRAMCYVPVNCILSIAFLLDIKEDLDFVSFTRVLAFSCGRYARSDHLHGSLPDLTKLAKFAWEKYKIKTYRFRASELNEAGLSDETIHAFLHFAVVDSTDLRVTILDGDQLSYFSHLVMHEFFAAAFLMLVMSDEDFSCHLPLLLEDQYEVVARCAFGLCHNTISTHLPFKFSSKFLERKEMLKDLAISHLKSNSRSILKVLSWIHEAHDDVITKSFVTNLPDQIVLRGSFFQTDSSSLAYVMQASSRRHDVIMTSCKFRGESFERFARLVAEHNIKIGRLDVGGVPIGNHGLEPLTKCVHLIDKLIIDGCRITDVSQLADNISQRSTPMGLLSLKNYPITNASVLPLANCIHNLEELELENCHITDISPLTKSIETLPQPMTYLSLSGNKIGNSGANQLSTCLHNIEELDLDECDISDISRLAESVSRLRKPMTCLSLNLNPIGDHGAVALEKCVHNIKYLLLRSCLISNIDGLTRAINAMPERMTGLIIRENPNWQRQCMSINPIALIEGNNLPRRLRKNNFHFNRVCKNEDKRDKYFQKRMYSVIQKCKHSDKKTTT